MEGAVLTFEQREWRNSWKICVSIVCVLGKIWMVHFPCKYYKCKFLVSLARQVFWTGDTRTETDLLAAILCSLWNSKAVVKKHSNSHSFCSLSYERSIAFLKGVLHTVRSSTSCLNFQYPLMSSTSFSHCLHSVFIFTSISLTFNEQRFSYV